MKLTPTDCLKRSSFFETLKRWFKAAKQIIYFYSCFMDASKELLSVVYPGGSDLM